MAHSVTRAAIVAVAISAASVANAGTITGYLFTDANAAAANATLAQFTALGGASSANAKFSFSGTTNFTNAPGNNSNVTTIDQFLGSGSGSGGGGVAAIGGTTGSHILNNTYFYFTGLVGLKSGANLFTITHDDGFELNIDGVSPHPIISTPGPTAPFPTTYTVNAPSAGNYNFELAYGETAGGPAQLTVFGGTLQVSEAGSLAVLGGGMGLLGFAGSRRRRA